jgi:hypothetical protein
MRYPILAVSLVFASSLAQAQDVSLLAGALRANTGEESSSFAVNAGYTQHLSPYFSVSADYLNEGHPKFHHRDGIGAQFWAHTLVPEKGWSFGTGFGPYYYFDTTTGNGSLFDYRNDHGWGQIASVNAIYHLHSQAYIETRLSHTHGIASHDSSEIMIGLGYELGHVARADRLDNADSGDNLIMALAGRSVVNSFKSEAAVATGLEYRRTLTPNLEWSVMLLNEGKIETSDRKGIATQLWLLRPFTERTVLEMGFGAYAMRDQLDRADPNDAHETHVAPIASIGMRYRINERWRAQLTWSRVITNYERDSDLFMLGAGMAF